MAKEKVQHTPEWLAFQRKIRQKKRELKLRDVGNKHLCDICGMKFDEKYRLRVSIFHICIKFNIKYISF